jgi:hypothetical protein
VIGAVAWMGNTLELTAEAQIPVGISFYIDERQLSKKKNV